MLIMWATIYIIVYRVFQRIVINYNLHYLLESNICHVLFSSDAEWWTSETRDGLSSTIEYVESSSEISASSVDDEPVYFVSPGLNIVLLFVT